MKVTFQHPWVLCPREHLIGIFTKSTILLLSCQLLVIPIAVHPMAHVFHYKMGLSQCFVGSMLVNQAFCWPLVMLTDWGHNLISRVDVTSCKNKLLPYQGEKIWKKFTHHQVTYWSHWVILSHQELLYDYFGWKSRHSSVTITWSTLIRRSSRWWTSYIAFILVPMAFKRPLKKTLVTEERSWLLSTQQGYPLWWMLSGKD